jgi:hypothetical protein
MIFDRFATAIERQWPLMKGVADATKLFDFPGRAHEVLPQEHTEETVERLKADFFLPYSNVFIEDSASGVLLQDTEEEQRGISGRRLFSVVIPLDGTNDGEFADSPESATFEESVQHFTEHAEKNDSIYAQSEGSLLDGRTLAPGGKRRSDLFGAGISAEKSARGDYQAMQAIGDSDKIAYGHTNPYLAKNLTPEQRQERVAAMDEQWKKMADMVPKGTCLFVFGEVEVPELSTTGMRLACKVQQAWVGGKRKGYTDWFEMTIPPLVQDVLAKMTPDEMKDGEALLKIIKDARDVEQASLNREASIHIHTALEEIMFFNTPDRFVMESTPVGKAATKNKNKKKILRSDQRPRYTLLRPSEIRGVMGIEAPAPGDKNTPRPHERRRHYRTFRAERYKAAKGKRIVVEATWVGPQEAVVGNKKYRVCTDI